MNEKSKNIIDCKKLKKTLIDRFNEDMEEKREFRRLKKEEEDKLKPKSESEED